VVDASFGADDGEPVAQPRDRHGRERCRIRRRGLEVAEENSVGGVWILGSLMAAAPVERVVRRGQGRGMIRVSEERRRGVVRS
jgi:hypothetical protein